ncbi:MAG: UbiH/UbiF/VisC/COQ6 family ubiquinone biosynthesis hydroxylase [Halieaceae bacterium]
MSNPDYDVIVIGAGIAGSALLRSLAGSGLRLALVEAAPLAADSPNTSAAQSVADFDARVSAITPASQTFLTDIGAWDLLGQQRLGPYSHMQVWDAEGTGSIDFHAGELDAPVLGHIVENRQLTAALLSGLDACTDLQVFSPARLQALDLSAADRVQLELEDGRQLTGNLLVAADGALSRVRDLARFQTREWDYGQYALVTTVETSSQHQATAWQRFLSTGPLAFLPLPSYGERHFCSIVWSAEPALAQALKEMPEAEFQQALEEAIEGRLGTVLASSARTVFPLRQRHAVDYIKPRIALVGDAAHTIHPLAGQGINLGIQDVAALSLELRQAVRRGIDAGDSAVLRRYQRQRKGENLVMMAAMDGFKRLFGQQQLPLRWLRNSGMNLVARSGPLKHQLMRHAMGVR